MESAFAVFIKTLFLIVFTCLMFHCEFIAIIHALGAQFGPPVPFDEQRLARMECALLAIERTLDPVSSDRVRERNVQLLRQVEKLEKENLDQQAVILERASERDAAKKEWDSLAEERDNFRMKVTKAVRELKAAKRELRDGANLNAGERVSHALALIGAWSAISANQEEVSGDGK